MTYSYKCTNPICKTEVFDKRVPLKDYQVLQHCPECNKKCKRTITTAPAAHGADTGGRNGKPTLPRDN